MYQVFNKDIYSLLIYLTGLTYGVFTKNGKFITVEGGECVGKSTFIKALSSKLKEENIDHITTREPGGTIVGEKLRNIFDNLTSKETLSIESELFIVSAGRSQHINHKIQPALAKTNGLSVTDSVILL